MSHFSNSNSLLLSNGFRAKLLSQGLSPKETVLVNGQHNDSWPNLTFDNCSDKNIANRQAKNNETKGIQKKENETINLILK